jgi:hypothetical protein
MNSTATAARNFQVNNMTSGDFQMVIHSANCSSAMDDRRGQINNSWVATGFSVEEVIAAEIKALEDGGFGPGVFGPEHFHAMPCAK